MSSLEELQSKVEELSAQVDESKKTIDNKEKEAKSAMEEKDKEHKEAMGEEQKKHEAMMNENKEKHEALKASLQAEIDKETDEKKKEGMKAALKAMDEEHKEKEAKSAKYGEDDEEKKALKAEVQYLANVVKEPKINYLKQVYEAAKTPEEDLKEYVANWEKMDGPQLDAAIKQTERLAGRIKESFEASQKNPFGPTMSAKPTKVESFSAEKTYGKIDETSDKDLFANKGGPYK